MFTVQSGILQVSEARAEAAETRVAELEAALRSWAEQYSLRAGALEASNQRLREALQGLVSAFMAHTHWNGEPPAEITAARKELEKK